MRFATEQFSRRTFLISGTAFIATLPVLRSHSMPLQAHAVGWGSHGLKFHTGFRAKQLSIASVLDTNPSRARVAVEQVSRFQAVLPKYYCSVGSFVDALRRRSDDLPILLCSPPNTWLPLLSALRSRQPVLAYHTHCFDPAGVFHLQQVLDRFRERVFLLGLDPAWPRSSLGPFFDFARFRGACESLAQIEHSDWSDAQLAAFHFEFLDCAGAAINDSSLHTFRAFLRPTPTDMSIGSPAACRFRASGVGIELETAMEIRDRIADSTEGLESVEAFRAFVGNTVEHRRRNFERTRLLLERVRAGQLRF